LTASICDDTTELDGGSHVGIGGQVIQFQAYGGDLGDVGRIEYRFWVSQPDNNGGDNYLEIVAFGPSSDGLGRYPLATGQYMCYNTNDPSPGGAPTQPSGCSSSGSIGTTNICCSGIGYGTYGHSKQYPAYGYDNEIITINGVTLPVGMNGGGPIEIGVYDVYIDIVHIGGNTTGWVEATLIP
jgi:hypothetical protein